MTAPAGFVRHASADGELWIDPGFADAARELELGDLGAWQRLLAEGEHGGRGQVAFVEAGGEYAALKQLRRGGLAGPLWRDRFPNRTRLVENLTIPARARERGVATPPALALLLVSGPPGLWRGWLAVRGIRDAVDLMRRVRSQPPTREQWSVALGVVRGLHDAGIEHPDLNLGILLLDANEAGWVLDLDGSRLHADALDVDRRIDGIRRVERSYHKTCFLNRLQPADAIDWPALYGGDDPALEARWQERSDGDLARLARHRRGWRR